MSKQNFDHKYEVIVVDNASTDGSQELVKKQFSWAKLIQNNSNLGFPAGNNIGIQAAAGKYIILLNYDAVADKNFIKELVAAMEREPAAVAAQAKILLFDDRELINTTGTVVNYLGFGWCGDYRQISTDHMEEREIAAPSGAAVIFRKDIYEKLGGLDDDFFLYYEDTDLGLRARLNDYKIIFAPKAVVWHKYSFGRTATKYYFAERNRLVMLLKNYSTRTLLLLLPALLIVETGMLLYSIIDMWFVLKIRGWWWILSNMSNIMRKRAVVQAARKLPDRALVELLQPKIRFEEIKNPVLEHVLNPFLAAYWRAVKRFI